MALQVAYAPDPLKADAITQVSTAADGSQANGNSVISSISADIRYAIFYSVVTNLVAGDAGTLDTGDFN